MKLKIFRKIAQSLAILSFATVVFGSFLMVAYAIDYVPLAPIPETLNASRGTDLPTYLKGLFKVGIAAAGVLAFLVIVWGGFTYLSTDAFTGKEEGKERIKRAVGGLILALGAYIILRTINPSLVNLDLNFGDKLAAKKGLHVQSLKEAQDGFDRAYEQAGKDALAIKAERQGLEAEAKAAREQAQNTNLTAAEKLRLEKKAEAKEAEAQAVASFKETKTEISLAMKQGNVSIAKFPTAGLNHLGTIANELQTQITHIDGNTSTKIGTIQAASAKDPLHKSKYDQWILELKTQANLSKQEMKEKLKEALHENFRLSDAWKREVNNQINWGKTW